MVDRHTVVRMLNSPGNQGHSLGLSVGATNLAGTRDGQTAVIHPAELTLHGQRLTGFVDRVGDPVPLIALDGSRHRPEDLLANALGAMAQAVTDGMPVSDVTISVPAHWRPSVVDTLRRNLRDKLPVVSDATAALTALCANPGLPTNGVIVLCDFGGSGTSITLANAARDFSQFGETVRFPDFSGDRIDQALLTHVVAGLVDVDPSGTALVGSLVRMRDECRRAKERLSADTATVVVADLPGHRADIRVTRTELEDLMQAPLTELLAVLDETLERYGVPPASVAAVATIGGGARIPLITQRLSEHLRAPVVTTHRPQLTAAEGAALLAQRRLTPTDPGAVASTVALVAHEQKLAWSEDDAGEDVLPYSDVTDSRPELQFRHEEWHDEPPPRRGRRRPRPHRQHLRRRRLPIPRRRRHRRHHPPRHPSRRRSIPGPVTAAPARGPAEPEPGRARAQLPEREPAQPEPAVPRTVRTAGTTGTGTGGTTTAPKA
jgi:molecular chaperone DnaK (HSP70)